MSIRPSQSLPTDPPKPRGPAEICLQVHDLEAQGRFYRDLLGMSVFAAGRLGFDEQGCCLSLRPGAKAPHKADAEGLYWKIGITLRDLDHAVSYLKDRGWPVSEPRQFRDIGYMSHLHDPEGFAIELLQQGFVGAAEPAGAGHPIGGQATLAHLTLRTVDQTAMTSLFEQRLGMRLLSHQPVKDLGFSLFFYAWSDEALPDPDLEAVANRPWLWARPYGLVEVQHLESGERLNPPDPATAGVTGFRYLDEAGALQEVSLEDLAPLAGPTSA